MKTNELSAAAIVATTLIAGATVAQPHTYAGKQPDTMWTYKQVDGKELQLHVFLPPDYAEDKRFPAVVVFHGGSWNGGDPSWHYPDCAYWSSRGMIAAAVSYRLRTRDKIQVPLECVKDAKSAIRFLRKNNERLKVEPDHIVAAGGSAGGQLAAATAMITAKEVNDDSYDLAISCVPNAVVGYNPWLRCQPELNPADNVVPDLPPTICFLGSKDPLPVPELGAFHEKMLAAGNASEFYVGIGAGHGFCNGRNPQNPYFYWSIELVDRFLTKHGILTGEPNIQRPEGLPAIETEAYAAEGSK
ncbi:MAG: alpha/beta hydrolase [Verrucomicrobia bacterium]|nr:alpha/beta hydrolase [Verrucomicrobiota bacterium]